MTRFAPSGEDCEQCEKASKIFFPLSQPRLLLVPVESFDSFQTFFSSSSATSLLSCHRQSELGIQLDGCYTLTIFVHCKRCIVGSRMYHSRLHIAAHRLHPHVITLGSFCEFLHQQLKSAATSAAASIQQNFSSK